MSDKATGGAMLFASASIFIYYTAWTILLPFFDVSSPVHEYFPSREWAVRVPAFVLVVGISAISLFLGLAIVKDQQQ